MIKINSSINNAAKNTNTIKFNKWKGVVNGNIFEPTPYPTGAGCEIRLDFSCEDNSQYIGVI
jgi:hypothetical protein